MATRVWKSMFGARDDLEKKLQNLSSEEKAVHTRIKRRARSSRQLLGHVIKISISLEVLVVIYAVMMGREADLGWEIRALRVLPVVAVPTLAALIYFIFGSFRKIFEEKDKNRLEWLREERRTKINELKKKSNYYATQILIQRYDLDPAEKAAAAKVLATKLSTESGLKLSIGDQSEDATSSLDYDSDEETEGNNNKADLEKYKVSEGNNEGWFGKIAALLVGEHPSQCFALICSKCFTHNGLARKEDLPFIRYYCPNCHELNGSQQSNVESEMETPLSAVTGEIDVSSSAAVVEQVHESNIQEEEEKEVDREGN
ncbi:hypothetical protein LUZ60_012029 [Juncus effusus]|nr:hypothetical protein LUZ60_012029 [Juncus effusus]